MFLMFFAWFCKRFVVYILHDIFVIYLCFICHLYVVAFVSIKLIDRHWFNELLLCQLIDLCDRYINKKCVCFFVFFLRKFFCFSAKMCIPWFGPFFSLCNRSPSVRFRIFRGFAMNQRKIKNISELRLCDSVCVCVRSFFFIDSEGKKNVVVKHWLILLAIGAGAVVSFVHRKFWINLFAFKLYCLVTSFFFFHILFTRSMNDSSFLWFLYVNNMMAQMTISTTIQIRGDIKCEMFDIFFLLTINANITSKDQMPFWYAENNDVDEMREKRRKHTKKANRSTMNLCKCCVHINM